MPKKVNFKPYDLVFAKIKGYPHWPARIENFEFEDGKPAKKYPVLFYGTEETAMIKAEDIFIFEDTVDKFGYAHKNKGFNEGLWLIQNNPNYNPKIFLPDEQTILSSIPAGPSGAAKPKTPGSNDSPMEEDAEAKKRKRRESDVGEKKNKSTAETPEPQMSRSGRVIKPKKVMDNNEEESKKRVSNVASPALQTKKKMANGTSKKDEFVDFENDEASAAFLEDKKKGNDSFKSKSLDIEHQLLDLDQKIREALSVTSPKKDDAKTYLDKMASLYISGLMIKKNPHVVDAIKKCRRYKFDDEVRSKADIVYNKFKLVFLVAENQDWESLFSEKVAQFDEACLKNNISEEAKVSLARDPTYFSVDIQQGNVGVVADKENIISSLIGEVNGCQITAED